MRTRRYRKRGGACPDGPDCKPSIFEDPLSAVGNLAKDGFGAAQNFAKSPMDGIKNGAAVVTGAAGQLQGNLDNLTAESKKKFGEATSMFNLSAAPQPTSPSTGGRRRKSKRRRTKRR